MDWSSHAQKTEPSRTCRGYCNDDGTSGRGAKVPSPTPERSPSIASNYRRTSEAADRITIFVVAKRLHRDSRLRLITRVWNQ